VVALILLEMLIDFDEAREYRSRLNELRTASDSTEGNTSLLIFTTNLAETTTKVRIHPGGRVSRAMLFTRVTLRQPTGVSQV